MKKPRKPMESSSIRIYEEIMKKRLLNNLLWFLVIGLFFESVPLYANNLVFLILNDGVNLTDEAERLENLGANVQKRIPPQILVADLPSSINVKSLTSAKTVYTTPIPTSVLEPLGPLAVAAGLQWNRQILNQTKTSNERNFAAMRVLVAQKSLPSPQNVVPTLTPDLIHLVWDGVDGALYYEIEVAADNSFSKTLVRTHSLIREVDLPIPDGSSSTKIFIHVRGVDRVTADDGERSDIFGNWSRAIDVGISPIASNTSAPTPMLTSPIPDYKSEGTTIILEWSGASPLNRVQVSNSSDFSNTLFDAIVQGKEFICPSPALRTDDILYWRVKAWGSSKSSWTDARKLTIGAPHHDKADMFINPEAPK